MLKKSNSRRLWTLLTSAIIFTLLLSGCGTARQTTVYRVGILSGISFLADSVDGFKEGMAELGYVEGENIIYDVQSTEFDMEVYKSILQKFVADDVDLILAFPTEASIEAKAATAGTDIPVLFSYSLIEGMGLVDSVRQPGGNITGVRYPGPDIAIRRFEVLIQMVPDAKRVFVTYQRGYPIVPPQLEVLRPAAEAAGVTLIEFPADNGAELQAELDARANSDDVGMDAILIIVEPFVPNPDNYAILAKFAYEQDIPLGGSYISADPYSNLFGIDVLSFESAKDAAVLADKIFKGSVAGTIPVSSADSVLRIDYRVAQHFGLTVPDGLLKQADEIIK